MVTASLLFLFILMLVVLAAGQEAESATYYPRGEGKCRGCAYDLSGLPAGRPCPECGDADPRATETRVSRRVVGHLVWRRMCLTLSLGTIASATMVPVLHIVHVWSYQVQFGDRPVVIARAMRARGFDLAWEPAMLPMLAGSAVCMVLCLAGGQFRFGRAAARITALSWVASLAWLIVMTWVIYG